MLSKKSMYFDYAASTPVASEVFRAMKPYFLEKFGNPGSLHSFGQEAMAAVDNTRELLASSLGVDFREIVFTASATEANNLALRGSARTGSRVIVSSGEHESVLETALVLERAGIEVVKIPIDHKGIIKMNALVSALNENVSVVSIMYANNETGTVQPIEKIGALLKEFRSRHALSAPLLFHTDASQAFQFLDCNVQKLGVDLMTISGHKIYGPKGVGVLHVKKGVGLATAQTGGGQEFGLRSGTENVPALVGFGAAVKYIEKDKEKYARRIKNLKDIFLRDLKKKYPRATLNGTVRGLPHIANVWLPGRDAQDMLIRLDLAGMAISAGSACTARSSKPSHVLRAMGFNEKRARESLRISFGRTTTGQEIKALLRVL